MTAFPKMGDPFFNLLAERVRANKFTTKRLNDAINHLIDNFNYKELNIADIIKFDKRAKLYSYNDVCKMVSKGEATFSDFAVNREIEKHSYRFDRVCRRHENYRGKVQAVLQRAEQDPVQGMRFPGRGSEILRVQQGLHGPSEAGS